MGALVESVSPDDPWTMPLERIDVADPRLYRDDVWEPYFARLRRDDPVHFVASNEMYGSFWSVTKYNDIMQVDTNHRLFSSEQGGITLLDDYRVGSNFIAMDPPKHDEQRKVVSPVVAPGNLANMAPVIRECAGGILDSLPRNETFVGQNGFAVGKRSSRDGTCEGIFRAPVPVCSPGARTKGDLHDTATSA